MADSVGERLAAMEATFKEFKDAITKSISGLDTLLWRAILGGIAATVSLWIGFATLYKEIAGLDKRMISVESKIDTLQGTATRVSEVITSIPGAIAELKNIANVPRSGNAEQPGTLNILVFDARQLVLIRDTFPKSTGVQILNSADKLAVGDVVDDPKLFSLFVPVPPPALTDIPQLAGTRFLVGEGNIVFARIADNKIVGRVVR